MAVLLITHDLGVVAELLPPRGHHLRRAIVDMAPFAKYLRGAAGIPTPEACCVPAAT